MLYEFLETNRTELIERCRAKVALRPAPLPTPQEMDYGIPLFLEQLIETLRLEQVGSGAPQALDSAASLVAARHVPSELAASATKHGRELLRHGFTVDQVVHDYGDLCQAVTELAIEKDAPVSPAEFRTLNRCLDNAIADAVTEFGWQRDRLAFEESSRALNEQLGNLAHELRNFLNTAILSFAAIKRGHVGLEGSTAAVLDRSLSTLSDLIDRALTDVRLDGSLKPLFAPVAVDRFVADLQVGASLDAKARGCEFEVAPVAPGLAIRVDRPLLDSAVSNLLQNAFKFTHNHGRVCLSARAAEGHLLIEVEDRCGGLADGIAEAMFDSFRQHHTNRSGIGLGLSISRRAVEANGGLLTVRNLPGVGCVFTIDLPLAPHPPPVGAVAHRQPVEAT